jgi:membrane protein DedA with SNARE-associated domain
MTQLVETYGLVVVAVLVGLESVCLPVPGETVLILAAIFAGTHRHMDGAQHHLNIVAIVMTASAAAIVGQSIGYVIGRQFGYRLLVRYGPYLQVTEGRIKLGQYLFLRNGVAIVIATRFVPVLRSTAGVLAGANRMPWKLFIFACVVGALVWVSFISYTVFLLGNLVERAGHTVAIILGIFAAAVIIAGINFVRRHEARLIAEAELALPGPLESR